MAEPVSLVSLEPESDSVEEAALRDLNSWLA
jgi:hypothetical protein